MAKRLCGISLGFVFSLLSLISPAQAADVTPNELAFLDDLTLVVLDTEDIPSLHLARRLIQSKGGRVAVMSPPSLLIGWIPYELEDELIGKMGIQSIHYSEVAPAEFDRGNSRSKAAIEFFNSAVRGDITYDHYIKKESRLSAAAPPERRPDVFEPEPIEYGAYIENLRNAGLDIAELEKDGFLPDPTTPAITGNSDYLTGTIALTVFFVESDGSGSDPDQYTWTSEHMQYYLNGVLGAVTFWANKAASHGDCWATFLINYYSGADPVTQQWVEPILHGSSWQSTWIDEIMTNLGYTSGGYFTKVTSFNTWQRSHYQTDRSYSAFVPYNPSPAPPHFPDGATAYAYLGGPFTVLLYAVMGWTTQEVFAHESGHIFYACDEYAGGCGTYSCTSVCRNGSLNANCEACNSGSRDCMMKENSFSLCTYTPTHVGWGVNSPCAPPEPPPLDTPAISSISPGQGYHGFDVTVTVNGSNFFAGAKLDLGSDVFVNTTELTGQSTLIANVSILADASPGIRDAKIKNRDGQTATLPNAFEVLRTTRHYYSATGGNNYPFITPGDAATSLQSAIDATYDGDTLFMPTMTFDDFSMIVGHGLLLHGAWNNDFTQRDLQSGKTVINLNGNLTFLGASEGTGIDGFLLQNGTGAGDIVPFIGHYGGAVRFVGVPAVVANCEIRSNSVGSAMEYGLGGGVYAQDCSVDIRDNYFHTNTATQGGAIHLRNCSGAISGNTISNNSVSGISETLLGAGVLAWDCPNLSFSGNTFSSNTGAEEGGGLYVTNTAALTMTGDVFDANSSELSGGGIRLTGTNAVISGLELTGNSCAGIGGGMTAEAGDLTLTGSTVMANSAVAGGGVYATGGDQCVVDYNLFVGNDGSATGGALLLTGFSSGRVAGNTVDQNSSGANAGLLVGNSPVALFNNIVTNSTGTGIACTGPALPTLTYNLVWNSSGDDYNGAVPGEGSLSADPIFLDPASGDYHLGLHSPAIDSGDPGLMNEDPDGSRGDMGVYGSHTFVMDQPSYPKNLTAAGNGGDVELSWDGNPEPDVDFYALYCDVIDGFTPTSSNFVMLIPGTDTTVTVTPPADTSYYRISAVDLDGYAGGYSAATTSSNATAVGDPVARHRFQLRQNVPNPFNPITRISYELGSRTEVTLTVYDVDGRLVKTLVNGTKGPGTFTATWEGKNDNGEPVASGVYFYRLNAGSYAQTKKMVFLK
ncbi:MAG: T9SS type A sorting domain-containing protein [Candidatus Latescibacterota bacterium]|nr:MAG: T9SS type A sorting domain-containing protein [Candidatus Latescibacterota bacterium]